MTVGINIKNEQNSILIKKNHNSSFFVQLSVLETLIKHTLQKIKIIKKIKDLHVCKSHQYCLDIQIFIEFKSSLHNIFYQIQTIKRQITKIIFINLKIKISNLSVIY